jgi:hypothetical protein
MNMNQTLETLVNTIHPLRQGQVSVSTSRVAFLVFLAQVVMYLQHTFAPKALQRFSL